MPRRLLLVLVAGLSLVAASVLPAVARDRPFGTSRLAVRPEIGAVGGAAATTGGTGQISKVQIERYRCAVRAGAAYGSPGGAMDISCNDVQPYRQDFNPDNEIAVVVNPWHPRHVVAGSNDYFYRFNNATGARQAVVPTGFFTSFDAGASWVDGQVPMRSGNGAGDPSPAFVGRLSSRTDPRRSVVLMAQLENTGGLSGAFVAQGDVSVSRSTDGGVTWSEPVTVFKGTGTGIGPANRATFYDKEWLTVDNYPASPHYGRAYLVTTRFLNGLQGSYAESPIWLAYSDDGGRTWSRPREISGSNPLCSLQSSGPAGECDEDQFGIPEVAPNGDLLVHFVNGQVASQFEVPGEFDNTIMVVRSTDGGRTFSNPVPVVSIEDGAADTPYSVIGRQTVTGHQIRWTAVGTIAADPTNARHWVVVYADNFAGTRDVGPASCLGDIPGTAPDYNPCGAVTNTNVYLAESFDGGRTWAPRRTVDGSAGDAWFAWADFGPDGTLHVAYDSNENVEDPGGDRDDTFTHVYRTVAPRASAAAPFTVSAKVLLAPDGAGRRAAEHVDESVTHWAGQYVPQPAWPRVCGPDGYTDPPVTDAEGKDCNVFHGDYTGLAVGSDGVANIVWTGLNRRATSPQVDPYTGGPHDGYAQDAMYARR